MGNEVVQPGFFDNPWVISITSGILFLFLSNLIVQRKNKKRHKEQISLANNEVIMILKPYVVDKGLPNNDIINSIISSTARKYSIQSNEMYSIKTICEELIKEVLESVYVTNDKKQMYSDQLSSYISKAIEYTEIVESKGEGNITKSRFFSGTGFIVAILTTIITLISTFLTLPVPSQPTEHDWMNIIQISIIVGLALAIITAVIIVIIKVRKKKDIKSNS